MIIGFDGRVFSHKEMTGVERYSLEIFNQFKALNKHVVMYKPNAESRYIQHLWEYSILPIKAKNSKVDLLFCPAGAAPFNLDRKMKLVVTIHDIAFLKFPEIYSFQFRKYYQTVLPLIIRRADRIIAISNSELQNIVQRYPQAENKIGAIHEGISGSFEFRNLNRERTILAVGSLNRHKNLSSLLKAFKRNLNRIPHKLVIVGSKRDIISRDSTLYELIDEIPGNRIVLKGYVSDNELADLYNKADLFVFPSIYEGFGLPPLESMACGCPVVASDVASLPEVCGDAAYYVDPYDISDIAKGIYDVLNDEQLQNQLRQKGLERVKLFSWKKTAKEILEVFDEILK